MNDREGKTLFRLIECNLNRHNSNKFPTQSEFYHTRVIASYEIFINKFHLAYL